jgi:hypothetical protein
MEITLSTRRYSGELVIKDGNTTLEIDAIDGGEASWEIIDQLTDVTLEMFEFNNRTRNDFVMNFARKYMTSDDVERLIDSLKNEYTTT